MHTPINFIHNQYPVTAKMFTNTLFGVKLTSITHLNKIDQATDTLTVNACTQNFKQCV